MEIKMINFQKQLKNKKQLKVTFLVSYKKEN